MKLPGRPFAPFTWSYSALQSFETCAKRHFHYKVQRDIREPETPQLRAGNELHEAFDQRIKLGTPLPLGLGHYEPLLSSIINAPGKTYSEQKLALTSSFQPTGYFDKQVWYRNVIDAAKVRDDDTAAAFDWKTGKPARDLTQMQLVAATMFHHMPKLRQVRTALVFVNHGHTERADFERGDLTGIWGEILPRVKKLEEAKANLEYPPKPSGLCKKYCEVMHCVYHGKGA